MIFSSRNRAHHGQRQGRILPMGAPLPRTGFGPGERPAKLARPLRLIIILLLAATSWAPLYTAAHAMGWL